MKTLDNVKIQKALDSIYMFGGYDGSHHKQWLLDQLVRILADDYDKWVAEYEDGEKGQKGHGQEFPGQNISEPLNALEVEEHTVEHGEDPEPE